MIKGIVHEMGKLVSNSQFWYGEYDYGLKLANFADSPFKGGCPSSDNSNHHRKTLTIIILQTLGGYAGEGDPVIWSLDTVPPLYQSEANKSVIDTYIDTEDN